MRYAIIIGNTVDGVIIASNLLDASNIATAKGGFAYRVDNLDPQPGPGWHYEAGAFSPPDAVVVPRLLTYNELIERFTDDELGTLQGLADTQQAIRGWLVWLQSRVTIDLDDTRLTTRLQQAVSLGYLTQVRVDEILS